MTELTDLEAGVLDVERHWREHGSVKETVIRERIGITATRYYLILNGLLDSEAALAHDPGLVGRLRRLRDERASERRRRRRALP